MSVTSDDFLGHPAAAHFLDDLPVPLMIYCRDGLLQAMNRRAEELWSADRAVLVGRFNLLSDPQSAARGSARMFERALAGEHFHSEPFPYDTSQVDVERRSDRKLWLQARAFPLRDPAGGEGRVAVIYEDVSEQMEQRGAIAAARDQIDRQRSEIETISTPIIQVWDGILTVPLVGSLDGRRAMGVAERLLEAIVERQADIVILDITGVGVVDTGVAQALMQAARAVRLLGSQVVLVGLSAEIAQTLVHLGVDLTQITTLANLQAGIAWAFEHLGLAVGPA